MPPLLSAAQGFAGRCQGFNKRSDDDLELPFDLLNRGEITDSDTISQQVKLCSEVDEENTETMNELFSKLYNEAEKIKQWKLTVESELNQKERKLQENRKMIEAQNKAIQELQFENDKLHLKLEDEICENKDLLQEASDSRHLCNLLQESYTHFTEKTSKYEQEKEETRQLYVELHSNIERMTVAFEELRVQAEKNRLEMSFKLKEEAEKVENLEKECKLEVSQKEKQKEVHDLKVQLTSRAEKEQDYLKQLLTLKTDLEREAFKNEQLTVCLNKLSLEKELIAQEKNGVAAELKKLQEKQEK